LVASKCYWMEMLQRKLGPTLQFTTMTLKETLTELEALGNEKMRAQNTKHGAGDNQFGVRSGDVRKLAKKIKTNHELAIALWETGNIDARFLAILLIEPKTLSADEMDRMVRSVTFVEVADWLNNHVVKKHPDKETLRQGWMVPDDPMAALAIGEALGIYRDYPVSKGCTSPFAPIWISEMVSRQP